MAGKRHGRNCNRTKGSLSRALPPVKPAQVDGKAGLHLQESGSCFNSSLIFSMELKEEPPKSMNRRPRQRGLKAKEFHQKLLQAQEERILKAEEHHLKLLQAEEEIWILKAEELHQKLLQAQEDLIELYRNDNLRLELELIQARSTNVLRGVFELLEDKLHSLAPRTYSSLSRYKKWELYLARIKNLAENLQARTQWQMGKDQLQNMCDIYKTLSFDVDDEEHGATKILRGLNGIWEVSKFPLTEVQAAAMNVVAKHLKLKIVVE